jgi:ABC-2 type transport system permease protein
MGYGAAGLRHRRYMDTTNKTVSKRKSQQKQAVIRIVVLAAILVCANILASRVHYGLDLTKEKRFTLSPATKNMLRNLEDVVTVEVYLKGKFPAGIQKLADETREKLNTFNNYSSKKIIYKFTNPFEGKTDDEKGPIYQELVRKGVVGKELNVNTEDEGQSQSMFFPYAVVQYKGRELPVTLLEAGIGYDPLQQLSISESMLEYKLASAIHKLNMADKPTIAYAVGHGEPLGLNTLDLLRTLERNYHVDTFDLSTSYYINPVVYSAIIINRPTTIIREEEKFIIDQYVMRGGHVLWCIDPLNAPLDSLQHSDNFLTNDYVLNLDDILFNYGVRVNKDLVEDMQCNEIPVMMGMTEQGRPQTELRPWMYFPVLIPSSKHAIVNNMDAIMGQFVSSIDTVGGPEIKKTVLLESSKYSRTAPNPVRVNMAMLQYKLRPEMFQKPYQPVAVLLEGKFKSIFRNRPPAPGFAAILRDSLKQPYMDHADSATSMIVIADGDMFANGFTEGNGPEPMGYWRYNKTNFANKSFLLNCLEYLTDKNTLLEARTKDVKLRLLDNGRIRDERNKWRVVNIGIPIAMVLVFASAFMFFRKKKYETKKEKV